MDSRGDPEADVIKHGYLWGEKASESAEGPWQLAVAFVASSVVKTAGFVVQAVHCRTE